MTIIDLIRHAEPDTQIHDDQARPLTALGQQQARHLATQLTPVPYTAVYSSPLTRAQTTVQPLARRLGLPVQLDARLRERELPTWRADFAAYVAAQWQDLTMSDAEGESIRDVQRRYLAFMARVPETAHVAAGAHGTAIASVFEAMHPGAGYAYWQTLPYASVTRVVLHHGQLVTVARWPG